jgi:DNA-binding HxlR family transcriptional regulator
MLLLCVRVGGVYTGYLASITHFASPKYTGGNQVNELRRFSVDCPSRLLFDQIADKWSMMVLTVLDREPLRFNAIKRLLEGVTQKALTQCLRRLERNGFVSRRVVPVSPIAVEYAITPLGRSLLQPFRALYEWTVENYSAVAEAQQEFEAAAQG